MLSKMQNRYHIRQICTCFLYWVTFLLSSSSENFPKHVYLAKPSQILMGLCQLLSHSSSSFHTALLLTFLWPSVTGPQCSGCSTSCSQCLQKHQQGQFIPPCLWLHIVLVQIILLLSSFTVCPHIICLSNYFSSACCAVFIRMMFLPARPALGLLIFKVWCLAALHPFKFIVISLQVFFFSIFLISFSSQLFLCKHMLWGLLYHVMASSAS